MSDPDTEQRLADLELVVASLAADKGPSPRPDLNGALRRLAERARARGAGLRAANITVDVHHAAPPVDPGFAAYLARHLNREDPHA